MEGSNKNILYVKIICERYERSRLEVPSGLVGTIKHDNIDGPAWLIRPATSAGYRKKVIEYAVNQDGTLEVVSSTFPAITAIVM